MRLRVAVGQPSAPVVAERRAQIEADLSGDAPAWNTLGVGTGNMTVTLDGTTPPLSLLGFTAGRSNVIGGDRQGVMAFGLRGDTGDGLFLLLGIEPELYAIGTIPVDVYSVFSIVNQGPLGPSMPLRGFAVGTLELDQAGTTSGEPVSGSFDVQVWGQGAQVVALVRERRALAAAHKTPSSSSSSIRTRRAASVTRDLRASGRLRAVVDEEIAE